MNIGCDIVYNYRLKNKSQRFVDLVLTPNEQKQYLKKGYLYLCGRFAAKEAIMKVLKNTKCLNFLDIEILNNQTGQPYCNFKNIKISISHEKDITMAVAILTN